MEWCTKQRVHKQPWTKKKTHPPKTSGFSKGFCAPKPDVQPTLCCLTRPELALCTGSWCSPRQKHRRPWWDANHSPGARHSSANRCHCSCPGPHCTKTQQKWPGFWWKKSPTFWNSEKDVSIFKKKTNTYWFWTSWMFFWHNFFKARRQWCRSFPAPKRSSHDGQTPYLRSAEKKKRIRPRREQKGELARALINFWGAFWRCWGMKYELRYNQHTSRWYKLVNLSTGWTAIREKLVESLWPFDALL